MRFNRGARLDPSRVRDRRGMGGGRGGRGGVAMGGGLGGLVLLVIVMLAGGDPSAILGGGGAPQDGPAGGELEQCDSGADIQANAECRFVAVENSLKGYWDGAFEQQGQPFEPATLTTFTGSVNTGCGSATSQVGPFYCPPDQGMYLDIGFFETLQTQLGGQGGDFAEAYVLAHEYGHHIQNLTGAMERVRSRQGANSDAVQLELQADCYAGVWANHATTTPTENGEPLIVEVSRADVAEAIDAAETVGDDYIQERMGGQVSPETWTHGSSAQRREAFEAGMAQGDPAACNAYAPGR